MSKKDSPLRIPSLHITENDLIRVLDEIYYDAQDSQDPEQLNPDRLARAILEYSKGLSCNNRSILVKNKKEIAKAQSTLNPSEKAYMFSQILTNYRRSLKHRGVVNIEESHAQFALVKKITLLVEEFKTETDLSFKEACKNFITWGVYLMGKHYSINKFISLASKILDVYLADKEIDADKYPDLTTEVIQSYFQKVYTKTGIREEGIVENPLKYVEFVRMVEFCKRKGYNPKEYLEAQFEGLDWTGGIPDPAQLNSVSSVERFVKFAYKHNLKNEQKTETKPKVAWDKILEK